MVKKLIGNKQLTLIAFVFATSFWACQTTQQATSNSDSSKENKVNIAKLSRPYKASATKQHDLIHTRLEISFDWENRRLIGEAEVTLKPHFYATDKLFLDARGMQINEVKLIDGDKKSELAYVYRNDSICITMDKIYSRLDTFKIYVNYIAKPDELAKGGSAAITDDKGLYFINADNSNPSKPQQIWSQGETKANSVWFPTIDWTNQKTTQEIYITVDTSFVTVSNGLLISSILNSSNGTRTDYWRQMIPHAPYLVMIGVGKFAVVKDKWRNKEVNYYVEPAFEKYASKIFNHTPEMIEFFSNKMGIDYPWDKFSQIIVRDYVSGAMENSSIVVYGEFAQKDDRGLLDDNNDEYVSHELFHHWFGDMVTCESWSNLPLNESFATYGEYLWNEYKYGRDEADFNGQGDLNDYLREARTKQVDLIRFHYEKQEDMFDRHSYAKGGRVLHMLRKYVGDDAFFASLNHYLLKHKFETVEIHDLRIAFEEITGEDLNWFFNQWFLSKGHPILKIDYTFDASNLKQLVTIEQTQNFETTPLYKIPLDVDIYSKTGVQHEKITISKQKETFSFNVDSKPELVNVDAEKMLLCTKTDNHTNAEWVTMYKRAPLYLDRMEALNKISGSYKAGTSEGDVMKSALHDSHWRIRSAAIAKSKPLIDADRPEIKKILISLGKNDPKSDVRDAALTMLSEEYANDEDVNKLLYSAVNDSSYMVMNTALLSIIESNQIEGLALVRKLESDPNENIAHIVADIYSLYGDDNQFEYMTTVLQNANSENKYAAVSDYGKFLQLCKSTNALKGLEVIAEIGTNYPMWYVRLSAAQTLSEIAKSYGKTSLKQTGEAPVKSNTTLSDREEIENSLVRKRAEELLLQMKASEKDENLLKIYGKN